MKKVLLLLLLALFTTVSGISSSAVAAESSNTSAVSKKSKRVASKKNSKQVASKTGKKKVARKHRHKRVHQVYLAPTPLRTLKINSEQAWDDSALLDLKSAAALVVDQETGEALYAKNIEVPTAIASITKLMTAMVTVDANLPMDEVLTITSEDLDRVKGTHSKLMPGAQVTREEVLNLALIASDNRAAAALARNYPGGRPAFIAAMNAKAASLGMSNSRFVDSTGLYSGNRSTAIDLAKMVDAASQYPLLSEISSTGSFDIDLPARHVVRIRDHGRIKRVTRETTRRFTVNNTNMLTRNEDWDIGLSKTGFINEAGRCLVMQTKIAQQKVIIVLLDSWGKWTRIGDANRIKKWLEQNERFAQRATRDAS